MRRILKKLSKFSNKHKILFPTLVTLISVLITKGFELCAYLFHCGRYVYLGIPKEYVQVDMNTSLVGFIITVLIVGCVFLLVLLHRIWISSILENSSGIKKIIKIAISLAIIPICFMILLVAYLYTQMRLENIILYIQTYPFNFLGYVFIITVYYIILLYGVGNIAGFSSETLNEEKRYEIKHNWEKIRPYIEKVVNPLVLFILMIGVLLLGYFLFDIGKNSMEFVAEVSIVETEGNQYVILERYEDSWIVKECTYDNEELIINEEQYMLMDISGKSILRVKLQDGKTIRSCMVSEAVFSNSNNRS